MPASERQQYIETLRQFPDRLEARVRPLTDEQLDQRIAPSEWSTRQIVHHLADSHMSANFRFRLPLEGDNPTVPTYDQDAWAQMPDYRLPLEPSFLILRGLHQRFVALLEALTDEQWRRPVTHYRWGTVDVEEIARRYADHCDNHIAQINTTGAQFGW
jgi:hypothetical protein